MHSFCVVTPNYNMGRFLAETIESVLANLRPGDEYFVIDGGSNDDSVDIIKSYADRLTGWVSEPDAGYGDALAKGFGRSHSAFQCWINSGDLLLAGALDAARARLSRGDVDLLFGDDFYIDEQSRVIFHSRGKVNNLRDAMLYGGWTPLQDACFWTRDLYQRAGGIDGSLKVAADYDFFLRLTGLGRVVYAPTSFSAYRRHSGQKSVALAHEYNIERSRCRRREIEKETLFPLLKLALSTYYYCWARCSARILQPLLRNKELSGTPIFDIGCRNHEQPGRS